jgi:hypothetical protein
VADAAVTDDYPNRSHQAIKWRHNVGDMVVTVAGAAMWVIVVMLVLLGMVERMEGMK